MNIEDEKSLEKLNEEIEKELLQKMENKAGPELEDEYVTVPITKIIFDVAVVVLMILFIIANIAIIIWKLL